MLESIAGQEVPWGLAEAVHRQTEGNPLFVQEVVRYLAEEGVITREEGRWQAKGHAGGDEHTRRTEGCHRQATVLLKRIATSCFPWRRSSDGTSGWRYCRRSPG